MGGQLERLLGGNPLADLGPPPGSTSLQFRDVLLDRVATYLAAAWGTTLAGGNPDEMPSLTRMALNVGPRHPQHDTFHQISQALDLPTFGPRGLGGLALAATIAASACQPPNPAEKH